MMVNPYDDSRLMLALQIDHFRVPAFSRPIGATKTLPARSPIHPSCWPLTSTTAAGGNGR